MPLTPADLALPEKFTSWRPGQLETAAKVAGSDKYAFLLDAPTGSGKSLIAAAVQRLAEKNVAYLCTTKQLQDQLLHDFPYARTLKGRSNYRCLKYPRMFPSVTAEFCSHTEDRPCEHYSDCPYVVAKRMALRAPLAVLNTAYFLAEANFVGGFSEQEIVVVDEFDTIEDQLMNFIEVAITQKQLTRLNIPPPKYKTKFEAWVEWARGAIRLIAPEAESLRREATSDWSTFDLDLLRRKQQLERLLSKLRFFVSEVDKNWVWYPGTDRWVFKPVWVSKYAQGSLWKHTKKVLGMSATILDARQASVNVGLFTKGYSYKSLPSPFPKENRPVFYEPCANVVNRNMDVALPKLASALEDIMNKHEKDRILVHTVSYKVRDYLKNHIASKRIITHATTDRIQVLETFKASNRPLVLLSPSMDRGVDLPDDECRVVVIAKMPYPDLSDPQVNKRVHASADGNTWYAHKTISAIVQMSGRACRSAEDHATTYVLDAQFGKLYKEYKGYFPGWFKEAVVM